MEIVIVDLNDLISDPENPRSHSEENIQAIADSLARFGQVLPLLVRNEDCRVVAGNGTLEAMRRLGWTEAKAALYDGGDAECRALSVVLNRTGELASWDEVNLAKAIAGLKESGFDAWDKLGFDENSLSNLLCGLPLKHVEFDVKENSKDFSSAFVYSVIVDFDNEKDQAALLCRLEKENLRCRLLIS